MESAEHFVDKLINSVNDAFKTIALSKLKKGNNNMEIQEQELNIPQTQELPFSNPEQYRQVTGRRFRLHKEEAAQGLNREEAFNIRLPQLIAEWQESDNN